MKQLSCIVIAVVCLAFAVPTVTLAADDRVQTAAAAVATVNVNTADVNELQSLTGIGQVTAERIVAYRTDHGNFRVSEDLIKVKGVGKKTLEKIRDLVSVE